MFKNLIIFTFHLDKKLTMKKLAARREDVAIHVIAILKNFPLNFKCKFCQ
jgi:hypothetical protein